ncbi:MAG TPA: protein kinase [Polyangiaceae bacterium]
MSDDTALQFGHSLREPAPEAPQGSPPAAALPAATSPRATQCPICSSRFSPDGHFCPFDGTPLVAAPDWDPSSDRLIGTLVDGRYEVLGAIGEGGMGRVYQVRHRALGKRFALKALRQDLAVDGEIAARFIQEARTAAAVSHPGLVEITDFGRLESGQVYFVMELLEGTSLAALLRLGGPLPVERGLDIVRQLVHALKAAHDAAIVHRDLKPDNVHVGKGDGERDLVKVVDFGLAKVIGSSKLTRAGMVFGTPHYMSPEQAAGDAVDHRADIYALGVVMYEMFAGKLPFEADSYMGVLTKHLYMEPTPPSQLCPQLSQLGALEEVILRCLQKRPEARYPDLGALLDDLDRRLPAGEPARTPARTGSERGRREFSLLADQLELPNLSPAPSAALRRLWPLAVVTVAFALGALVVVLAGRLGKHAEAPALPVSAGGPRLAPVVSSPPTAPSVPPKAKESSSPPPARQPSGITPQTRKPLGSEPQRPTRQTPQRPTRPTPQRPGDREIVDPWAR